MMVAVGPEQRARSDASHLRQKQKSSGGSVGGSGAGQKQKSSALDKGSSASAMDRQLESVMSAAREVLLQPQATQEEKDATLSACRARFDGIAARFAAASASADYYVTRARFEEFCGKHEAVADLYALAAKNEAEPSEVVQENFLQFLQRQSQALKAGAGQAAPKAAPKAADKQPAPATKAPRTPLGKSAGARRIKTPSSLRSGARRVPVRASQQKPMREAPSSAGAGVLRTPTLGPPLRVFTPAAQTAAVLDFGDASQQEPEAEPEAGAEPEEALPLPTSLQDFVMEQQKLKHQERASSQPSAQMTATVVFSPVRVPKSAVEETGSRVALTPVRRSPRINRAANLPERTLDDLLAETEYCYRPNEAVKALQDEALHDDSKM